MNTNPNAALRQPNYPVKVQLTPAELSILSHSAWVGDESEWKAAAGNAARDLNYWRRREMHISVAMADGCLVLRDADDALLAFTAFSTTMYFADIEHKTADGRRNAIAAAESLHAKLEAISGQPVPWPAALGRR